MKYLKLMRDGLDVDDGPNIVYPSNHYLIKYLLNECVRVGLR